MSSDEGQPLVAFLGPKASYTHQATLSQFPEPKYTLLGKTSIEEVFQAVQSKATPHGVVPFENSSNGPVGFTLDLFADTNAKYPDILVEGEVYLPVRHCLVGHHSQTDDPDSPYSHITRLYSHPQAWTQCNQFLSTHFKGIERIDVSSTSRAAELVALDTNKTSAAISSAIAAKLNNIPVLAEGIEDVKGNTTRFLVIRRRDSPPSFPVGNDSKTLLSFRLKHHGQSGALAESLSVFAKLGLNLTSFHSRPSREAPWHYVFFLEVQGWKEDDEESGTVNAALKELERHVEEYRWLGSWENKRKVV